MATPQAEAVVANQSEVTAVEVFLLNPASETPELREENVADFSGAKLLFARSYNRARRFRVLRRTMLPVAPFFEIVARKRGGVVNDRART